MIFYSIKAVETAEPIPNAKQRVVSLKNIHLVGFGNDETYSNRIEQDQ